MRAEQTTTMTPLSEGTLETTPVGKAAHHARSGVVWITVLKIKDNDERMGRRIIKA